jgi:hypothetical protein
MQNMQSVLIRRLVLTVELASSELERTVMAVLPSSRMAPYNQLSLSPQTA